MKFERLWREMRGRRVTCQFRVCLYCDGRDGVLCQHHCKDELELYCDWCERWTGIRVTYQEAETWVEGSTSCTALYRGCTA